MKVRLTSLSIGLFLVAGLALAANAGPTTPTGDSDGDGIPEYVDNCTAIANASQADSNHDGCGDPCSFENITCDFNGDGVVGIPDFNTWKASVNINANGDCTGDGITGIPDFNLWKAQIGNAGPGPSGITNASRDFTTCP